MAWPEDILINWPGWCTRFDLAYRHEVSRDGWGMPSVADRGTPIWRGAWQTKPLRPHALSYWKARLNSVQGGAGTFYGYDMRKYPSAHSNGTGLPGSPKVGSISGDKSSLSLSSASGLHLNIGDHISIGNNLHRATSTSNNGSAFTVEPYLMLDVVTGNDVLLVNPRCIMRAIAESISGEADITGWGTLTFEAYQDVQYSA